uniref:Urechistachykinin receptor n=1 Tax=Urechis unicinctus TaxID=6432 RepID=Q8T8D1_UREUN|nr:urechistachykinin receptor [Urechis unicinctus]BAC54121.1 Uru-TK receptor [Urechis unicinctus]
MAFQSQTPVPPEYLVLGHGVETLTVASNMSDSTAVAMVNTTASGTAVVPGSNPFILPWYLQLIFILMFVVMVLVATGGNIIVIWIVMAHKRMRTVTNYFLVNLAVADALISIFNTLFNFVYLLNNHWVFELPFCKFTQFIAPCTIAASVFTFVAIAVDRYIAIVHPLKPRMGSRSVLGVIAVIWVFSILVAFPNILYAVTETFSYTDGSSRTVCYLLWPDGHNNTMDFVYNIFLMVVEYFLPLLILACAYSMVGCSLWRGQTIGERIPRHEETVRSKRRVVKMMMVVVVIFAVCWLPQHVFFLLTNCYEGLPEVDSVQLIYLCIYWLAMSNSMYNPIIYCWMNARFRKGFKYVFRWLPGVAWKPSDTTGLGRGGPICARMSLSEGTKYTYADKNGSVMQTYVESMDETSSTNIQLKNFNSRFYRNNDEAKL